MNVPHQTWPNHSRKNHALCVSANGRYLEYTDGVPFFYLGDTAWSLFHRLNLEEAAHYLDNRSKKGFTVIQANVIGELDGLVMPNANGDLPFTDIDPLQPNEAYFRHMDAIMTEANKRGLIIGMLPTWNRYCDIQSEQRIFTPENAEAYGRFLGERYKDTALIWILGGDFNCNREEEKETVRLIAKGLAQGDDGKHLITYHPMGPGRSSDFFHTEDWLDFNMIQSSHAAHDYDNGAMTTHDYNLTPVKPTLDGEPRYESIVTGFYFNNCNPVDRCTDYDARQAAYWSLLAGACGHTYGNNNIWQMWTPNLEPAISACVPWHEAVDHAGSFHMSHVRKLMESRKFHLLEPAPHIIVDGPATGGAKIRAALASDRSCAIIYSPRGESFSINLDPVGESRVSQTWFDPRYGTFHSIHTGCNSGILTFDPPTTGKGCDWIMVIDAATS